MTFLKTAVAVVFALGASAADPLTPAKEEVSRLSKELEGVEAELKTTRLAEEELARARTNLGNNDPAKADRDRVTLAALAGHARALEARQKKLVADLDAARKRVDEAVAAAPVGPCVELVVNPADAPYPYTLAEYGEKGKPVGTVDVSTAALLGKTLARLANDPAAPKELRVATRPEAKAEHLRAALEACQAAGIKKVTLTGSYSVWVTKTGRALPRVEYAPVVRKFDREEVGVESLLRQITPPKP